MPLPGVYSCPSRGINRMAPSVSILQRSRITIAFMNGHNRESTATQPVRVKFDGATCFLQLFRPDARNAINRSMIEACLDVAAECERRASVLVIEGLPDVFCSGADFQEVASAAARPAANTEEPDA